MTLDELMTAWVIETEDRVDLADGTKENYQRLADNLIAWGGDHCLSELRLGDFVRHRRRGGISDRTITLELRVMTIATNWGRRKGLIDASIELNMPKLKVDPKKFVVNRNTPTPGEAGKAIAAMDRDDWRLATLLLARTGARVGEVVSLRGRDLDEHRGTVTFGTSQGDSKTGVRVFPLDDHSLRELRGRRQCGHLPLLDFCGLKDPKQGIRKRLLDACARAGVTPFTPHGLRRMVVGRLIRARVDPGTAATLTGHSVKVMLKHYQVVTDEDRREAAMRADLGVLSDE